MINPTLQLQFARTANPDGSANLDPRITFSRASSRTTTDCRGRLRYLDAGVAAAPFDPATGDSEGLLVEESRTNLLTYSEQFDNAAWAKVRSSISANATTAPDGTVTADKFVEDTTASNNHAFARTAYYSITANTKYTGTIYAKAGERTHFQFSLASTGYTSQVSCVFDLSTGTAGTVTYYGSGSAGEASIEPVGNGWYRCSLSGIVDAVSTTGNFNIVLHNGTTITYTGDGTSGLYLWGAQLEEGAFPTSYVPSTQTFTSRASTATYYDSTGTLQSAAIDTARMNYNPADLTAPAKLLLEGARTNLLTYSEDFDNAAWSRTAGITVTANTTTSPDGTVSADTLTVSTGGGVERLDRVISITDTGQTITQSLFVKANSFTGDILLRGYAVGGTVAVDSNSIFNLTTKTFSTTDPEVISEGFQELPNGWLRVWQSFKLNNDGATSVGFRIGTNSGTGTFYIWGAQLEEGSYPTSYVKTEAAAVTRAADVSSSAATTRAAESAVIDGQAFTDFYNQEEGTLLGEVNCLYDYIGSNTFPGVCRFSDGTLTNSISVSQRVLSAVTDIGTTIYKNGVIQNSDLSTLVEDNPTKFCMAYSENYLAIASTNDASLNKDTTDVNLPSVDRFEIGKAGSNAKKLAIKSLTYWPKKLSDAVLQALTS